MWNNIPDVKLGIVAVSRDCFPITLSQSRCAAVVEECGKLGVDIFSAPTTVENEKDMLAAVAEVKAAEVDVKSAEVKNLSASNEEWIKINANLSESKQRLEEQLANSVEKLDDAHKSKEAAWERYSDCRAECSKKDLVISELNWYRCEVNACPYRKPPRKYGDMDFPKDGVNPVENPDPNAL